MTNKKATKLIADLPIGLNNYKIILHKTRETFDAGHGRSTWHGYFEASTRECHILALWWETENGIDGIDDVETINVMQHELGHALHREHHPCRLLLELDRHEGVAEMASLAMGFWAMHGEQLTYEVKKQLHEWYNEEEKSDA